MAVVVARTQGPLEALEARDRELEGEIERLEGQVGGLRVDVAGLVLDAPDSAKLKTAKEKLRQAAGRLQTAQEDLEHVELAKVEWGRRETARMASEERQRREAAVARAHKLQDQREAEARRVDVAFEEMASALAAFYDTALSQRQAFLAAELEPAAKSAVPLSSLVEGAFRRALRSVDVPFSRFGLFDGMPPVNVQFLRPLADQDLDMRRYALPREEVSDGQ